MKLREPLLSKLGKKYAPSEIVKLKHRGKDVMVKTNSQGDPVTLFIGRLQEDGKIKGERYTRTLIQNADGTLVKDHWDFKGKA